MKLKEFIAYKIDRLTKKHMPLTCNIKNWGLSGFLSASLAGKVLIGG